MREFMNQGTELLRWGLAGKQDDSVSVAKAQSRGDALFELQCNALADDEIHEPFAVLAHVPGHLPGEFWKVASPVDEMSHTQADLNPTSMG